MKILVTPIHLDALILAGDTVVKDALADYSLLPYTDKTTDHNPDTPYLGEFILNHPFQDKNLLLRPGVHLHWALPMGLSRTVGIRMIRKKDLDPLEPYFRKVMLGIRDVWTPTRDFIWDTILMDSGWIKPLDKAGRASILDREAVDQTIFNRGVDELQARFADYRDAPFFAEALIKIMDTPPATEYQTVPDIWLVNRKKGDQIDKSWVVESSYIARIQTESDGNLSSVTVPFHDDRHDNKSQPFRFMGRRLEWDPTWTSGKLHGENYLQEITAVGYNPQAGSKGFAEPTFAAFYPNCLSVFGFHDAEVNAAQTGMTYEVLGLYSNPGNDYLKIFLDDFLNRHPKDENYFKRLNEALMGEFQWEIAEDSPLNSDEALPAASVLFGKAIPKVAQNTDAAQVQIAVGNTGTEALSACIAANLQGDKKELEELLEAIQFSAKLQNQVLDIGYKFKEARHSKGFTSSPGGHLWSISLESTVLQASAEHNEAQVQELTLPDNLAALLHETNSLQSAYHKANLELPYLRSQLYADWYKYMSCVYPPVDKKADFFDDDLLMAYIREGSIQPLQEKLQLLGTVQVAYDENGRFKSVSISGNPESIAGQLAEKLRQLDAAIRVFNEETGADGKSWKDKGKCLAIRQVAAPRFWRASDPVVLFVEKEATNQTPILDNDRHVTPGTRNIITCTLLDYDLTNPADFSFDEGLKLFYLVSILFDKLPQTGNTDSPSIWNPFMMEWAVEYLPAFPGSSEESDDRLYNNQYINQHYQLRETEPDFDLVSNSSVFDNANLFSGSTILTPHAGTRLGDAIEQFVNNFKDSQSETTLQILEAAGKFLKETNILSQSLGGFHEALLLKKQTRQLDVADPLGFPGYQAFSQEEVAPLVGRFNITAPDPFGDFNPIRCGLLRILNIRLIDSYGQTMEFTTPNTVNSETVSLDSNPATVHLKPRLSQPARLNFRFLSATWSGQEMNAHPASSPVCGWLMPNNLDRSLMFYDQDGSALGALTMNATNPWAPAPDAATTAFIDSIANLHLRKVARQLFDLQRQSIVTEGTADNSFLKHFLAALDSALETISPENFAEHQDLAVLMGSPIAVVRARLSLELEGPPQTDQSWTQLTHELHGHGRSSDDFTKVKFPIRLGDYNQLNDGLLGYWIESSEGRLAPQYISSEAGDNPDPLILTYHDGGAALNIYRALDDEPVCVTMLVNPLGSIHVTSGILPVKAISLPKDQYKNALKRIAVTFLTAPVLSPGDQLKLSLPSEPGFEWTWLEKTGDRQWEEIPQTVLIGKPLFDAKFPDQPTLWKQLVTKKWLQPLPDDPERALLTSAVHRAYPPPAAGNADAFPMDTGKRLDNFFDTYGKHIEPFDRLARFGGALVIREGWLQLGEAGKAAPPLKNTDTL